LEKEDKPANEADLQTIEWFGNQMNKTIAEIKINSQNSEFLMLCI
jgi:valyl-tRNA synthetase